MKRGVVLEAFVRDASIETARRALDGLNHILRRRSSDSLAVGDRARDEAAAAIDDGRRRARLGQAQQDVLEYVGRDASRERIADLAIDHARRVDPRLDGAIALDFADRDLARDSSLRQRGLVYG